MKFLLLIKILSLLTVKNSYSQEIECQGAILRILNKTTNEKTYFTVPLSQTIELSNSSIVIHRCVKVEKLGKNEEIALVTHKLNSTNKNKKDFFGWIFKSSQYLNSPANPVYDVKLEECLVEDPIFLKNKNTIWNIFLEYCLNCQEIFYL